MADGPTKEKKLGVFISYSRDDLEFADQLEIALRFANFEPSLDRHGISAAEDWKQRLGSLILAADAVVFVLSPSSALSEICVWEVKEAVRLGKRVIPVVCRDLVGVDAPPELAGLNYIFFYNDQKSPGSGFGAGLVKLATALSTDLDWLREHTRLLERANEWETIGRPTNRLLSGDDILAAKSWAGRRPKSAPPLTSLHLDFIKASEVWEVEQQNERQRQLKERERLVREAEEAVNSAAEAQAAREVAQQESAELAKRGEELAKREAATSKRVARRTTIGLIVALMLALAVGIAGTYAYILRQEAVQLANVAKNQRVTAEKQTALAEEQRLRAEQNSNAAQQALDAAQKAQSETLLNQSKYLAGIAERLTDRGDAGAALAIAIEALPSEISNDESTTNRPYWPVAEKVLNRALQEGRELAILRGHTNLISSLAVLSDGRVVTASKDMTVKVWAKNDGAWAATNTIIHEEPILSAAVLQGRRIATGTSTGLLQLWEEQDGAWKSVSKFKGKHGAISDIHALPDGSLATDSGDGSIRVWREVKGKWISIAALPSAGTHILALGALSDGRIVTFDSAGLGIWTEEDSSWTRVTIPHGSNLISSVAALTGNRIVIGAYDQETVQILEEQDGKWTIVTTLKGHEGGVLSVVVLPDGRIISGSTDKTVRIWAEENGTWRQAAILAGSGFGGIREIATLPGGRFVTRSVSENAARIWAADEVTLMPIVTVGRYGSEAPDRVAVLGNKRIVAHFDFGPEAVWAENNGTWINESTLIAGDQGRFSHVATLPRQRIVTVDYLGKVQVWALKSGSWTSASAIDGAYFDEPDEFIMSLTGLPDGRIAIGSYSGTASIWRETDNGWVSTIRLDDHEDGVESIGLFPDGRFLTAARDGTVRVWGQRGGKWSSEASLESLSYGQPAILPDGRIVAISKEGKSATIWAEKDGAWTAAATLKSRTSISILNIAVLPGGRIVTGSYDSSLQVWKEEHETWTLVADLSGFGTVRKGGLAVRPSGQLIVVTTEGTIKLLPAYLDSTANTLRYAKRTAPRCLTPEQRERFYLSLTTPDWCDKLDKWPYDAETRIARGHQALVKRKDAEANALFTKARAEAPHLDDIIETARAEGYFARGETHLTNGKLHEADIEFGKAFAIDKRLQDRINLSIANAHFGRGESGLGNEFDAVAEVEFAKALEKDSSLEERVNSAWAKAYFNRGKQKLDDKNDSGAELEFAKAIKKDEMFSAKIDVAWADTYVNRISTLIEELVQQSSNSKMEEISRRVIVIADSLIARFRSKIGSRLQKPFARAYYMRGLANSVSGNVGAAVTDFRQARELGLEVNSEELWIINSQRSYLLVKKGNYTSALVEAAISYTDREIEAAETALSSNMDRSGLISIYGPIGALYANLGPNKPPSAPISECDHLASYLYDPFRVTAAADSEDMDAAKAISACTTAINFDPDQPRYLYNRGRANGIAAEAADEIGDNAAAQRHWNAMHKDLQMAMSTNSRGFNGYPIAFNNMAYHHSFGLATQEATRDEEKGAALYVETFNRVIYCCWVKVANHLLNEVKQHDDGKLIRVIHELTKWAVALDAEGARQLLEELYDNGKLKRPVAGTTIAYATFTDAPPWLRAPKTK